MLVDNDNGVVILTLFRVLLVQNIVAKCCDDFDSSTRDARQLNSITDAVRVVRDEWAKALRPA